MSGMSPEVPFLVDDWTQQWDHAAQFLVPAIERGSDTVTEVRAALAEHRADLWVAEDAAAVTLDMGEDLVYWYAGGALDSLLAMAEAAETLAIEQGYSAITIYGRPGWARGGLSGFENHTFMRKQLGV